MVHCRDDQIPYRLSAEDHEEFYTSYIRSTIDFPACRNKNPVAYFLGAQPGSGKTTLRQRIMRNGDAIVINTDELRWFHPLYNELLNDPTTNEKASYFVNPDASDWSIRLYEEAIAQRCSIIIDSTLGGNVEYFVNRMKRLNSLGYRTEIHLLAIPPKVSKLGIHLRFESNRAQGDAERMVSIEVHDRNYHALVKNIRAIESACGNLVDNVYVYSRNQSFDLNVILESAKACDFNRAIDALEAERNKILVPAEQDNLDSKIQEVVSMIVRRGGDPAAFLEIMN